MAGQARPRPDAGLVGRSGLTYAFPILLGIGTLRIIMIKELALRPKVKCPTHLGRSNSVVRFAGDEGDHSAEEVGHSH